MSTEGNTIATKLLLAAPEMGLPCLGTTYLFFTSSMCSGPERGKIRTGKMISPLPWRRKAMGRKNSCKTNRNGWRLEVSKTSKKKHIMLKDRQKMELWEDTNNGKKTHLLLYQVLYPFLNECTEQQDWGTERTLLFEEPGPSASTEKRRFTLWTGAEQMRLWCLHSIRTSV